ncbi:CPBP family intramembrane glutamic endopeptidase [Bacillus mycoides]|uniref:CPBP family intramembrane glutamic endopeptidase n=1 Tax=Bacillus mycoides TaxID=1405 RepID=UPI00292CE338|nr:CPBP family intramembrane glutamic endopeptidase [Bacillus mycoides]WOA61691.1 CPBP family intramembrane glutamic endopeptidase [Bacillus mycoides]
MKVNQNIVLKIIGLEFLLMIFYMLNGAYQTITKPFSPVLQFIGLVPLAVGILIYLTIKNKWKFYFFDIKLNNSMKNTILLNSPLVLVLLVILLGNKGLNTTSVSDLFFMFIMQFFVVAFIEEIFFRGFMLKMLFSKGIKKSILISSFLFGITHLLQLIGGQSIEDTILQIIYAFLVGLVLSLLIVNKQSIIITIIFHAFNNFFNFMGNVQASSLFAYIIIAILFFYTIYLWKRANKKECIRQEINIAV